MRLNLNFLFLILYLVVGFIPNFGSVDRIATHWLYLNIVSFLSIIFFLFKNPEVNIIKSITSNKPLVIFIVFAVWAAISILYSINITESIITTIRLFSLILTTITVGLHLSQLDSLRNIFVFILFPIILYEIFRPTIEIYRITSQVHFTFELANFLETFTPNKNITAAIITAHMGFFFMLRFYLKKFENLFVLLIFFGTVVIFFISARASIIGLILSLVFVYILTFLKKKEKIYFLNKVCLSVIFGIFVSNLYLGSDNTASFQSRLTSVNTKDESTNQRVRFYKHGINHLLKNPIVGIGIGNWKLKSIEYDSENIKNYVVPYHLHNDFLQYGTETGIIGMLLYLSLFLALLVQNVKRIDSNYYLSISLIISLSVLFIDSNLNFPHHRPIMMILLALIISLTELNRTKDFEK